VNIGEIVVSPTARALSGLIESLGIPKVRRV
jgi:hypothetical protein